jgi:hypothetical protein
MCGIEGLGDGNFIPSYKETGCGRDHNKYTFISPGRNGVRPAPTL